MAHKESGMLSTFDPEEDCWIANPYGLAQASTCPRLSGSYLAHDLTSYSICNFPGTRENPGGSVTNDCTNEDGPPYRSSFLSFLAKSFCRTSI